MIAAYEWQCVANKDRAWVLGVNKDGMMSNVVAFVNRRIDGAWEVLVSGSPVVTEPSRIEAMKTAEKILKQQR